MRRLHRTATARSVGAGRGRRVWDCRGARARRLHFHRGRPGHPTLFGSSQAERAQGGSMMFARSLGIVVLALASFGCMEDAPEVETNFELARFQGRWFEIARIPRDHDADCHDTVADYRLTSSERLELTHTCFAGSPTGTKRDFRATAHVDDPDVPAKLTLQIGLYAGAYWVLD